jgi:large subunit ribosomal protein L7/L12
MGKKEADQAVEEKAADTQEAKGEEKAPAKDVSAGVQKIIDAVKKMTVLELSELVKALEEEFGVSAAMPMMAGVPAGAAAGGGGGEEEKTTFDVVLKAVGEKKIPVIKAIRAVTNLGLKEAKGIADAAPKPVKQGIPKEEAEQAKKVLEDAGATVEIE